MIRGMSEEDSFWKGSPSQWLNLGHYLITLLVTGGLVFWAIAGPFLPALFGLLLPACYALWCYLSVRTQVFELTNERLRISHGVINQTIDEVELYRVKETQMIRPWWMRLTGLASITMETSDRSTPYLVIPAIRQGVVLREQLRKNVELQRDRKRVREMDFEDSGGDTFDMG
jgi:uncharacterized membrane protein YdbT with pleckstrin-like domain